MSTVGDTGKGFGGDHTELLHQSRENYIFSYPTGTDFLMEKQASFNRVDLLEAQIYAIERVRQGGHDVPEEVIRRPV